VIIPTLIVELRLRLILGVDVVGVVVDNAKVGLMLIVKVNKSRYKKELYVNKYLGKLVVGVVLGSRVDGSALGEYDGTPEVGIIVDGTKVGLIL
jgi:hypothetical protein